MRLCINSLPVDAAAFIPSSPTPPLLHTTRTKSSVTLTPQDRISQDFNSQDEDENGVGDVQIPSTGISVNDEMEFSRKDKFRTELVPIQCSKQLAAQVVTSTISASLSASEDRLSDSSVSMFEAVRYLLAISPSTQNTASTSQNRTFVLVDVPPFSHSLVTKIKAFMGESSKLVAMLVTSRDAIHYDDAPAVYRMRRTDLELWKHAFPNLAIIAYRLDIPRDCREHITQVLDGYGPFALEENNNDLFTFVETGRPLTYNEWEHAVAQDILRGRRPVEENSHDFARDGHSTKSIRAKEQGKTILAIYTPGHSFGSVSYIFPETGLLCSGFGIPVEATRMDENPGMERTGPALDYRGYITTSRGGMAKQMESARHLVNTYADRFFVVLPSRGDPLVLEGEAEDRKVTLLDIIDQYEKVGKIYERLGITSLSDE